MDLRFSDEDEDFRRELRTWLGQALPQDMREQSFWRDKTDDESFQIRREWEAGKPRPASPGSCGRRSTAVAGAPRP